MSSPPIRVLLADDHPILRDGILVALRRAGHDVVGAVGTAADVLAMFAEHVPDVLLLDVRLPDGNGIEIVRELCDAYGEKARIVVFSGFNDPAIVHGAVRAGALGFVYKGVAPEHILRAVDAVSRGEAYFGPEAVKSLREVEPAGPEPSALTTREREIVALVARGMSSKEIADELEISWRTVGTHRERIMRKLDTRNVAGIVRWAFAKGLAFSS